MKRWKLWSSIAASLLSIGGGSTYIIWNRQPADATEQVADAQDISPHAQPPEPIPVRQNDENYSPFVAPASFNEPSANSRGTGVSRVSDDSATEQTEAAPPPRPWVGNGSATPRQDPPAQPQLQNTASRFAAPRAAQSATSTDSDPPAVVEGNEFVPVQTLAPLPESAAPAQAAQSQAAPAAEVDTGPVTQNESSTATESTAPAAEVAVDTATSPQAAPSKVSTQEPASESARAETPPRQPAAVPADSTSESTSSRATVGASRYSDMRRPAPPKLRSAVSDSNTNSNSNSIPTRTPAPPASLPETQSTPLPSQSRRQLGMRNANVAPHASALTSNAPGERKFEGLQSPSLSIERERPDETQVGKPAKFVIKVSNVGQVAAQNVVVTDQVPQGTRFLSATPETVPAADGSLVWELGVLQPNEDVTLTVELMPEVEGEIGSVAEVTFRIPSAVRTIATKPLLKVEHSGPAKVLIGQDVPFQITVSNPGSGIATGVVIEVDVPEGLTHDGGREIMSDRFDLRPNESKKLDLILRAAQPGIVQNVVRAVGEGNLVAEHRTQLEVLAPELQVAIAGPTKRFLDRPVKYQIGLSNPGTAAANNIELVVRLPRGLKFTAADKKGQYDPRQHAVLWSLEELPAGEQGMVELTALPTDTGEQKLHIEARASLGLAYQHEHVTLVEDITDLVFTVSDENVPIEVGSETTYQIRVANNGTKVATNIRLSVKVPQGLEITDSEGPSQVEQQGDQLLMQPIAQLAQGEEAVYRLTATGIRAGDQVLRVQLLSDEFSTPVMKEEITKVYSDK